jgi:ferrochelatase
MASGLTITILALAKISSMAKQGILLLQMGGPCCTANVQNFLYNLFSDPYIIQLPKFLKPYQKQFASFVSKRRAPKVMKNYEKIGGRSPILFETLCQAKALNKVLGNNYKCYIAMRYSYPFLKDTLQEMQQDNIEKLTVIPLYPQYSIATSGSSMIECMELFEASGFSQNIEISYIESWHDNPYYIELIANRIKDQLEILKNETELTLLFSAHGLPQKYVDDGDPYQKQIEDSVSLIVQRLSDDLNFRIYRDQLVSSQFTVNYQISYQSRVGPIKWLQPYTDKVLEDLGLRKSCKNLIVVPISFVGDHIETLEEISIGYKELAHESGIKNFLVTRLPKANPLLISALASLVKKSTLKYESLNLQSR